MSGLEGKIAVIASLAFPTIRLVGDEVIPEFDTDPGHRTTPMRHGTGG